MHSDDSLRDRDERTAAFEADLRSLVLTAFASGVPVEGTWEITLPVADAPDWRVAIEKTGAESNPRRPAGDE